MLAKLIQPFFRTYRIFIYTFLFITACNTNPLDVDVSAVESNLSISRFDSDLTSHKNDFDFLRNKYGNFFFRYCNNFIPRQIGDSSGPDSVLKHFITDADFIEVNHAVQDTFKNISETEEQIRNAFRHYKYYFPERKIPEVISFVSLFNYGVVSTDSVLGIGLDMYLGSSTKYYESLGFPVYKIVHMRKEYITVDAMRGWIESEFDDTKHDFISHISYKGKILYLLDALLPQLNDTLKTGYSAQQLKWCYGNEKNTWSFFVEKRLLFSNSLEQFSKYISEGPTTNGFPTESPGNIAAFIGWQIIKSYMKENPKVTINKLMSETDAAIILKDSKYKPKK